jgi:hypothetical protein
MPFFACHDCKDNTSSAAGLKIYRIQLSGDELRLRALVTKQKYVCGKLGEGLFLKVSAAIPYLLDDSGC